MITTEGKIHVKRFLAGEVGSIARSLALGVGPKVEALTDTFLDFEVARADIYLTSYDYVNDRLIFKATMPDNFAGKVYEAGLWSTEANADSAGFGSAIVSTFETSDEFWSGTFNGNNTRIGNESLQHTPAASATSTDSLTGIVLDLSGYSSADQFVFAYNVGNAFTSAITFRFMTDASNYYSIALGAQTAGYKVTRVTKGTAVPTGAPQWDNITQINVVTTSTAGGASAVSYDGIRVEDIDSPSSEYILVAREVLATPISRSTPVNQDIEFSLAVSIT